jgi:protein TonB
MKKIKPFPCLLCASAIIHGGIIFMVTIKSPSSAFMPKTPEAEAFSLVNVALLEMPLQAETRVLPERIPPITPKPDGPAENYIPEEEAALPREDASGAVSVPAAPTAHSGAASVARSDAEAGRDRALTAEYVQRNFNYIQRRIRDQLKYPPEARRAGVRGSADVSFTIHRDGTVSNVSVRTSSGRELLDAAALEAVHAAAPFPAPPAEARIAITIVFSLR